MSHELRTPLNAIIGYTQLLITDIHNRESNQQLKHIYDCGNHLLNMINNILDISIIEEGTIQISMEEVELKSELMNCVALLGNQMDEKGITVINKIIKEEIKILTDNVRLRQIILNILSNAIKYNKDNGKIILNLNSLDSDYELVIEDTGIGITKNFLEDNRLYGPFDRLAIQGDKIIGTGLGLTLAKTLIELMEGKIKITSDLGVGTRVHLRFPKFIEAKTSKKELEREAKGEVKKRKKKKGPNEKGNKGKGEAKIFKKGSKEKRKSKNIIEKEELDKGNKSGNTRDDKRRRNTEIEKSFVYNKKTKSLKNVKIREIKKVLIVEDNKSNYVLMEFIFKKYFPDVTYILKKDGGKAAEYIKNNPNEINLILLDLGLPDISGGEILKFMKVNGLLKTIPVIVNSAFVDTKLVEDIKKMGAKEYIRKPYNVDQVVKNVKKYLS